ncbi:hypothetical protein ANOM_002651 [Aspergillus nomiae NRRL 13137]|uniref:Rhodopsin domain-containing protein n=1 Tax=Aspergillus nomiae NRRL (strain ATCC 15546 / NRRL 13137 / CBS 260.88 / M93) TaxID=1509407 RepID=A0A0L1JC31_ASPN3|nr:uncharacterized protein ANOM_002651 [Aspergillus nomiae NRRL 13137]KNG89331.1 hypothetical protein ANOM_002651 [Aspergillus nomiae NRRL 13137]
MSASSLLMENIPDLDTRGQGTYKRFEEGSMCLHEKLYNSQTCRYPKVHSIHPKRSTMASSPHWTHLPFRLASAGEVLAAGVALPIACLACVTLRFLARARQKVCLGLDDWLLVPAAIMVTGMGICFIYGYSVHVMGYPTPYPISDDPKKALAKYNRAYEIEAKIEFYFQLFMIAAYGFIKASIVLFYRRIFVSNKKSRFAIISNICLAVTEVREHCGDPLAAESALVISDLITDLAILLLPFPKALSASVVRLAVYLIVFEVGYEAGYDPDQTVTTMLWWSMLEASLGLIAACLPTLRPVVYSARGWLLREGRKGFSGRWSRKLGSTGDQTSQGGTGATSVDGNKSSSVVILEPRAMV